jgi:hypothetical protein
MDTVTLVVNKLVEKYEYTHFEDEMAVISAMGKILIESFGKTQASFIINSDWFLGEALDEFYSATGAK